MSFQVDIKELDPQLVASITTRTFVGDLAQSIRSSLRTLREFAVDQCGEIVGAPFGIYHGPINEEADGPIEVCLPVRGTFSPSGEVVVRELDGGSGAQVLVRADQGATSPRFLGRTPPPWTGLPRMAIKAPARRVKRG